MTMNWTGSAAVCINQFSQVLMVLQGKPEEDKTWSVPSGGRELDESYEECCIREVLEETGYHIEIREMIYNKNDIVYYFLAEIIGGNSCIQDPDGLIYEVSWKSMEDLKKLNLSFEEDRDFLITIIEQRSVKTDYEQFYKHHKEGPASDNTIFTHRGIRPSVRTDEEDAGSKK